MKKLILLLLPLITLFSPMLFFRAPQWWSQVTASFPSSASDKPAGQGATGNPNGPEPQTPLVAGMEPVSVISGQVHEMADVLRFDVTPGWVLDRWPRVSAGLSQIQLQGYRVPLVTGTNEDDLAGSLTYYFNPRQEVQRLTFHGTTGDTRKLVDLLSSRYGFRRRLTNDPGVFLYETLNRHGKSNSFLWIRLAPVVKASEPLDRFEVALLMERPE